MVQMPADLRERSNGVCDGTGVSWSVVTQFLTQSAACLLGIFPVLTCGAGVLTDGLVRDVPCPGPVLAPAPRPLGRRRD
jgi:hypothetical protein